MMLLLRDDDDYMVASLLLFDEEGKSKKKISHFFLCVRAWVSECTYVVTKNYPYLFEIKERRGENVEKNNFECSYSGGDADSSPPENPGHLFYVVSRSFLKPSNKKQKHGIESPHNVHILKARKAEKQISKKSFSVYKLTEKERNRRKTKLTGAIFCVQKIPSLIRIIYISKKKVRNCS